MSCRIAVVPYPAITVGAKQGICGPAPVPFIRHDRLAHPLEEAPEGMVEALERSTLDGHRYRSHIRQGPPAHGQGLHLVEADE